jgi:glycosyltransferase involved in cell wall biosynthesis
MRILLVTDFYEPYVGGVEVVVRSLAHELSGRGHNVSVVTLRTEGLPEYEEDGAIRVHRIPLTAGRFEGLFGHGRTWAPPLPDPEASAGLRRIAVVEHPQIVHGHDWLARSFLPLKRVTRARFLMSLHYYTLSCAKKSLIYRGAPCAGPAAAKCIRCASRHYGAAKGPAVVATNFLFGRAERRAVDLFLPVSEATAMGNGLLDSGLPYEVIPNFVCDAPPLDREARQLVDTLPEGDFLLYVGDIRREKGVDVLLDAYRDLGNGPRLVLIGKLWPNWSPKLPPNVVFFEDWPNAAVREAQRRCLALVAPSVWPEPFGMVLIEALAAGRPVIGSRVGGIAEVVQHELNGLLVPPGDATALRTAVTSLVEDDWLVARLAEGARSSAGRFRAEAVVPRFEQAYARVQAAPQAQRFAPAP